MTLGRWVSVAFAAALFWWAGAVEARMIATGRAAAVKDGVRTSCDLGDANAIPFQPPSAKHRWGTILVGCFAKDRAGGAPALIVEWDLASARALRETVLPAPELADQIRLARGRRGVWVVLSVTIYEELTDSAVVYLDDQLNVKKRWSFPVTSSADIAAEGDLAAVSFFGFGANGTPRREVLRVVTFDAKRERRIGQKWIAQRRPIARSAHRPFAELGVRSGSVVVSVGHSDALELVRLGKDLRRVSARYVRKSDMGVFWESASFRLAAAPHGWVAGFSDALFELDERLRGTKRYAVSEARGPRADERFAIDPGSGRVATEEGWISDALGEPHWRALRFTHEVVSRTSKLERRADETRAVLWAFGRVVIVRSAPGLGVTAIELPNVSRRSPR